MSLPNPSFWSAQRVLLTGHTGFKGSWTSLWLERLGATVHGVALAPDHVPNLYSRITPLARHTVTIADIADAAMLAAVATEFRPTIVLHMAAQPLVRRSFADPAATFATNVMGTVNVFESLRKSPDLRAVLVVTTDKVYRNSGDGRRFVESDTLGGSDPYSASKACAELVAMSYARSFFGDLGVALATARAGNVVGGGDWSADRLVPDIWRAFHAGHPVELRYPLATRPWQHVLDSVAGYLCYLEHLVNGGVVPTALNFGPEEDEALTVADVADIMARHLGIEAWRPMAGRHPPEMAALALDASAARTALGWRARLDAPAALRWTADWYRGFDNGDDVRRLTIAQIEAYEALP
ncbi:MAG: CDP-glucose 4,6-dehydratase [Janthinobacterium lividum]